MPPELIPDEDYASSEDSDFAPDDAPGPESSDDEGGDDTSAATPAAGKRKRPTEDAADDAGFENSGDEAVISKGKKRRRKDKHKDGGADDDEGGEGGLVKTRSMRAAEKAERKAQVASGPVTVDVDALWAQMTTAPVVPTRSDGLEKPSEDGADGAGAEADEGRDSGHDRQGTEKEPAEMIKIKRTYNFAGKVHTEEKLVARESAEAKLYLASLGESTDPDAADDDAAPKHVPRKAFRSAFEPITDQVLQRADLNLGVAVRMRAREMAKEAKKLNTVEKSRMDWAGFVDKEGIKDELELAGKSKGSFAERQQFLARSEARREEDARRVRLAGKV
ncbi:SWR1-complex protein 5 [Pleurostoma richardsiae]|uniref:SWR1-complex protein 5 n=1 Tax=Pleurostoma richardsiae TaxID=41990 RepID=A0AA38RQP0_9PEZI|nr:SWR1-complex protein 5 [Pleurostoma richardsiae]